MRKIKPKSKENIFFYLCQRENIKRACTMNSLQKHNWLLHQNICVWTIRFRDLNNKHQGLKVNTYQGHVFRGYRIFP